MKQAIVSLSFDDGRRDNIRVAKELLMPRRIPATFNITTGYVDGTCPSALKPCTAPAMTREDVAWLNGHSMFELALHGDQHLNTDEDIATGRSKLIEWLAWEQNCQPGFASPGSGFDFSQKERLNSKLYQEEISYFRTSLRINSKHTLRVLSRKVGRVLHIPLLYRVAYADTLMDRCEDKIIYSVPIMHDTSAEQVIALVDLCVKRKLALTLMFHSVEDHVSPGENWSWEWNKMEMLLEKLVRLREMEKLQIATTRQLYEQLPQEKV